MSKKYFFWSGFDHAAARMLYASTAGGSTYYLAYDQVGSLRLVTDSSGAIVKRIDYDTFGNILSDSTPSFAIPFGFRDYMTEIGHWTAKDPILFAGGDANLYGYVGNDPVNLVDTDGLIKNTVDTTIEKAAAKGNIAELEGLLEATGNPAAKLIDWSIKS